VMPQSTLPAAIGPGCTPATKTRRRSPPHILRGLWHGTRTRLKNAVKMFITEPFDSCHEVRSGNSSKAGPEWLFPGANPVCKQQYFLRRSAFFDILLFPPEARGPKVLILMSEFRPSRKPGEAPVIKGELLLI
jgi:hypothetical protein